MDFLGLNENFLFGRGAGEVHVVDGARRDLRAEVVQHLCVPKFSGQPLTDQREKWKKKS